MKPALKKGLIIGGVAIGVGTGIYLGSRKLKSIKSKKAETFGNFYDDIKDHFEPLKNNSFREELKVDTNKYNGSTVTITKQLAIDLAKRIWNAEGVFNDDEEAVYDSLSQLKSKSDYQMVAVAFENLNANTEKVSLVYDLKSWMSESELSKVLNIIRKLN